jgi:hypothetical protein
LGGSNTCPTSATALAGKIGMKIIILALAISIHCACGDDPLIAIPDSSHTTNALKPKPVTKRLTIGTDFGGSLIGFVDETSGKTVMHVEIRLSSCSIECFFLGIHNELASAIVRKNVYSRDQDGGYLPGYSRSFVVTWEPGKDRVKKAPFLRNEIDEIDVTKEGLERLFLIFKKAMNTKPEEVNVEDVLSGEK